MEPAHPAFLFMLPITTVPFVDVTTEFVMLSLNVFKDVSISLVLVCIVVIEFVAVSAVV